MSVLQDRIRSEFINQFSLSPFLFRAPGRINLIGEHTDYNGGLVMPAAIDKEIVFAIHESQDDLTILFSADMNEFISVDLNHPDRIEKPHWANYLLGVIQRLKDKGYAIRPFKCVFGGDIPVGSGLSSSAALECGFVFALNSVFALGLPPLEMVQIAQWSEHHFAGVKCGIMDQFSSMMGKENHVFILDCRSMEFQYFPLALDNYEIILLDSNVKHSLASSEYNTRRLECETGVNILQSKYPDISTLRDATPEMIRDQKNILPGKVYDRCLYVTEEIERVQAAGKDLEANDLVAFGKKMFETHEGLSKLYEVSCPELDFLVIEAKGFKGVIGSRMMGGGFGGCTINIVASHVVDEWVEVCRKNYYQRFGIELKVYKVKTRDGVSEIVR